MTPGLSTSQKETITHWLDRWLFLFAAGVGACLIVVFRAIEWTGAWGPWAATICALVLMTAYLVSVTHLERFSLRPDQAGDNMYYLGFLYTLVSLAIALYQFSSGDKASEYIASNFGIALASTIYGVALRVVLHQMREDPVEVERETRIQLSEAASRLKSELSRSALEFSSFRREMGQVILEAQKESSDAITEMLDKASVDIRTAFGSASSAIRGIGDDLKKEVGHLSQATTKATKTFDRFTDKVDAIEAPADLVKRTMEPAMESVTNLMSKLDGYTQSHAALNDEITTRLRDMGAVVEGLRVSTDSVRGVLEELTERGVPAFNVALAELSSVLSSAQVSAVSAGTAQKEAFEALQGAARQQAEFLEQEAANLAGATTEFARALGETLDKIDHASEQISGRIEERHASLAQTLKAETLTALEESRRHREELDAELKAARSASEKLAEQLVAMATTMSVELEKRLIAS